MDFIFIWIIVQLANLVVWVLAARLALVRFHIDRHIYIPQCEPSEADEMMAGLSRRYKKCVSSLLEKDNNNIAGFAPPRALRALLVAIFALQNILGLVTIDQASPLQELLRRSGQMACVNVVPLVILAFPAAGLEMLVRQTSPQTAWAHHVYGWIVWHEALLHILTRALLSRNIDRAIQTAFGIVTGLLFCATTFWALNSWQMAIAGRGGTGHALVTRHGSLGFAVLIGITLHTLKTKYVFAGPLCMAVAATGTVLRQNRRGCRVEGELLGDGMVKIQQRVPLSVNAGEDCYYFVNGTPVRVAWVAFDGSPTASVPSAGTHPWGGQTVTVTEHEPGFQTVLTLMVAQPASLDRQGSTLPYSLEGPLHLSKNVYASSPVHLGIRCTDSGILESIALLQNRLAAEESLHTTILWFSKRRSLVDFLEAKISENANGRCKVNVIFYGGGPKPKAVNSASRGEDEPVEVWILPPAPLSKVLTHYQLYIEPDTRGGRTKTSVVVGEALRSYKWLSRRTRRCFVPAKQVIASKVSLSSNDEHHFPPAEVHMAPQVESQHAFIDCDVHQPREGSPLSNTSTAYPPDEVVESYLPPSKIPKIVIPRAKQNC